jgi:hypothetical protein
LVHVAFVSLTAPAVSAREKEEKREEGKVRSE